MCKVTKLYSILITATDLKTLPLHKIRNPGKHGKTIRRHTLGERWHSGCGKHHLHAQRIWLRQRRPNCHHAQRADTTRRQAAHESLLPPCVAQRLFLAARRDDRRQLPLAAAGNTDLPRFAPPCGRRRQDMGHQRPAGGRIPRERDIERDERAVEPATAHGPCRHIKVVADEPD